MSARPIEQKQRKRVSKALRRQPLPAYFDLVQWLIDHDYASTKRKARALILADRVRAGSHILGMETLNEQRVVSPYIRVDLRPDIVVLKA